MVFANVVPVGRTRDANGRRGESSRAVARHNASVSIFPALFRAREKPKGNYPGDKILRMGRFVFRISGDSFCRNAEEKLFFFLSCQTQPRIFVI